MIQLAKFGIIAAAIYGAWGIVLDNFPVSPWLEYRSVTVLDADYISPVMIIPDRDIHRPVFITYDVIVREVGNSRPVCVLNNGGGYTYQPNLTSDGERTPTGTVTLDYWSDGACSGARLTPGHYTITTEWTVQRPWPLPPGHVIVESNIFEVRPK